MGYRNDIAALQEKLNLVRTERDALRDELKLLRVEQVDAKAMIRREVYLRKELNKLRAMPEQLANSQIRSRQLEARIRELREREEQEVAPTPTYAGTARPQGHPAIPVVTLAVIVIYVIIQTVFG